MDEPFINANNAIDKSSRDSGKKSPYSFKNFHTQSKHSKSKVENAPKLRIGEVMMGEILQTFGEGIANVRLPNGILKAQLTDNLQTGDELMFIVVKSEKSLILKIHSVSSKIKGINREISEIVRILNLPENPFNKKLIEFLSKRRQYIYRDECLNLSFLFNRINSSEYSDISTKTVFKNLIFFNENKIEISGNAFSITKYSFIPTLFIEKALNSLRDKLNIHSDINTGSLKEQLNSIADDLSKQDFFIIRENSFAQNIIDLYNKIKQGTTGLPEEIIFLAKFINAAETVRIIQKTSGKPYKIRVPYIEMDKIRIVDILFDVSSSNSRYIFNLSDIYTVQVESGATATNIYLFTEDYNDEIAGFLEKIKSGFLDKNVNAVIKFADFSTLNKYSETEVSILKNQTFVV